MNARLLLTASLITLTSATQGCQQYQCRRPFQATCPRCAPACPTCPPRAGAIVPGPVPAGAFAPPTPSFAPAPSPGLPPAPVPSAAPNLDTRSFSSPAAPLPSWQAPQGNGRQPLPDATTSEPPVARDGGVRLQPPVISEVPRLETPKPAVTEERLLPTPSLPVGIPQFAAAKERVTSGLKPALDGFDWLQANGYRSVLHVRGPGDTDNADRVTIEKRGLKYISIEVTPQTLPQALAEFNRLVSDKALQPLFVYDRDGMLTGGLWYLHFRAVDKLPDDAARRKAAALGLKEDATGEAANLWLAIQEYVRKNLK